MQVVLRTLHSPTSLWTHGAQQNWANYTKCFHISEEVIKQKYTDVRSSYFPFTVPFYLTLTAKISSRREIAAT